MTFHFKLRLIALLVLLVSCAEQNSNLGKKAIINPKEKRVVSFRTENQVLPTNHVRNLQTPSLYFMIENTKDTTIYTKTGTSVFIPANCLQRTDDQSVDGLVKLELKELFDKASLVLTNKPTISNRSMLVTAGAIYVQATHDGKPLMISCKEGIKINIHKTSDYPNMEMFLGSINRNGNINWIKDSSLIEDVSPTEMDYETYAYEQNIEGMKVEYVPTQADKVFSTTKFGWINCDAFYQDVGPKTSMIVKLETQLPEDNTCHVFLVFKNINSVLPLYSADKINYESPLIPEGEEVVLVSIGGSGSRYYYNSKSTVIKPHSIETLHLNLSSEAEIKTALKAIN